MNSPLPRPLVPTFFTTLFLALAVFQPSTGCTAEGDYPLDLKTVANMDFQDEVAGDGKGGWSDQGSDNDLRGFDITLHNFAGVRFTIINPATNQRRAVLTFDNAHARTGLKTATVTVPAEAPAASYLYLLHTSCWNQEPKGTTIGTVDVTFADGQKLPIEIKNGRDIADWWGAGALENGRVVFSKANASNHVGIYLSRYALPSKPVRSVTFTSANNAVWILLGATLSNYAVDMKVQTVRFTANEEWKAVDFSDVRIQPGSALDLSASVEAGPAGKHGRVIASKEGRAVFEKNPGQALRFFGYDMVTTHIMNALKGKTDEETKANIREFVAEVKRQGYNVLRALCLDTYLMVEAEADVAFNPARLDAFDYLFATMKQEGIYLYLDLGGYGLFYKGSWDEKVVKRNMKAELFSGNPDVRENWKAGVTAVFTHVNPYTKTTLRDDPAVICANFYNEQELGFNKLTQAPNPTIYAALWHAWLKKRYGSIADVAKAWNDSTLSSLKSIDEIPLPGNPYGVDPSGNDYGLFLHGLETETVEWYTRVVGEIGYKGLASQYDCSQIYREGDARASLPAVSMHGYHAHPTNMTSVGSQVAQNSSIAAYAGYFRSLTSTRQWDKPFFVTEHTQCFWNQYQREDGLVFAAYSSLQDFQGLMVHENSTWLKVTEPMGNFSIGRSPIGRANEFLSHQLYRRGDVSASPRRVELRLEPEYLRSNINRPANWSQTRLALLTGFGSRYPRPDRPAPSRESDLLLAPVEGSTMTAGDWAVSVSESKASPGFSLSKAVEVLRERGILPKGNQTDVAKDLFQSDTGEITITPKEKRLSVITPRTEGVTLEDQQSATLATLTVQSTSVAAAVAVTAVDAQPLRTSRRLVLVYLTDTANSGMELSADRTTLIKLGTLPPLVRTGVLKVSLQNEASGKLKVWALGFNGARRELIPAQVKEGALEITLDTAKLKHGPTSFFEIAAE